jgi:glycine cleavage system transcriptional repressor
MSTTRHMVLTAVGPDRTGLVKQVSSIIHKAGANLEDSRMAVLAGEFALIVLFSGTDEALERITQDSALLEQELGFNLSFRPTRPRGEPARGRRYLLDVTGPDQPGIVHRVSELLAERQINVCSLESRLRHAAFSGTPLFQLTAEIELPTPENVSELRGKVEAACEALHLDHRLEPLPD